MELPTPGRCWTCGYDLRATTSGVCPECGRPFDPADARTTNHGRRPGRIGRFALGRLSAAWPLLCAVAAGLAWWTARWPGKGWRFSLADLRYYGDVGAWRAGRYLSMTQFDACYLCALGLGALLMAWWMVRAGLRIWAVLRYEREMGGRGAFGRRSAIGLTCLASIIAAVGVGWPIRMGLRAVAEINGPHPSVKMSPRLEPRVNIRLLPLPPASRVKMLDAADALFFDGAGDVALRAAARYGPTSNDRLTALGRLPYDADETVELLHDLVAHRSAGDPVTRAAAARLLALIAAGGPDRFVTNQTGRPVNVLRSADRRPAAIAALRTLADDPDASVRTAALDGLGVIYPGPPTKNLRQSNLATGPAIEAPEFTPGLDFATPPPGEVLALLRDRMTAAATSDERESAARGLIPWPQGGRLRYAEWGVFLADSTGKVGLTRQQLEEIPPFVHRVGNHARDLEDRITIDLTHSVFKPVIHLTSDRPMSVDIEVYIAGGKPWVVYPRFDDFVLHERPPIARAPRNRAAPRLASEEAADELLHDPPPGRFRIDALDLRGMADLPDLREGHPWLLPKHRDYPWLFPSGRSGPRPVDEKLRAIGSVGVRWQSVIVSPTTLPWMTPPAVPATPDHRFDWWDRLREVDCSWVSSRGESERFLYYDGPRLWPVPPREGDEDPPAEFRLMGSPRARHTVEVVVPAPAGAAAFEPAEFEAALIERGLTKSEAAGMSACWRKAFFETPGRRRLTFLSARDYAIMCPARVTPAPTEVARVGVMWEELGEDRP